MQPNLINYFFFDPNGEASIIPTYNSIRSPLGGCVADVACVITVTEGTAIPENISAASGENLTINAGSFDVTFEGSGEIILVGDAVEINAGSLDTAGRAITIGALSGTLTLNTDIDTSLTADDGSTTYGDINLTGTGATPIMFMGGVRTLLGGIISLTGAVTASNDFSITASSLDTTGGDLAITASNGILTLNTDINTSDSGRVMVGDLTLSANIDCARARSHDNIGA